MAISSVRERTTGNFVSDVAEDLGLGRRHLPLEGLPVVRKEYASEHPDIVVVERTVKPSAGRVVGRALANVLFAQS